MGKEEKDLGYVIETAERVAVDPSLSDSENAARVMACGMAAMKAFESDGYEKGAEPILRAAATVRQHKASGRHLK